MPIDFHDEANRATYAGRRIGAEWARAVRAHVRPSGARVVDVGCGGGDYLAAWRGLGAREVVGVDFSAAMLSGARDRLAGADGVVLHRGDALATGLPGGRADVVFQRALVHHLDDLAACFREARRLLAPHGTLLVQDRTVEDVTRPGSVRHPRGWFFEDRPELLAVERARRPSTATVTGAMRAAGFGPVTTTALTEVRRRHADRERFRADLLARTGRSILHELTDAQLADLADRVTARLPAGTPITESDHWTLWSARPLTAAPAPPTPGPDGTASARPGR